MYLTLCACCTGLIPPLATPLLHCSADAQQLCATQSVSVAEIKLSRRRVDGTGTLSPRLPMICALACERHVKVQNGGWVTSSPPYCPCSFVKPNTRPVARISTVTRGASCVKTAVCKSVMFNNNHSLTLIIYTRNL